MIILIQKIKKYILGVIYPNVNIVNKLIILGKFPFLKIPENGKVTLSNNVVLNSDFKKSNTALTNRCKLVTGYDGNITIGENTQLNGVCIVSYKKVTVGKNCQIASSTFIADTDFHPIDPVEREKQVLGKTYSLSSVANESVSIGNNVWIGWNSTILKGVSIGNNSIVAAGSMVLSGEYPANVIIAGNPAKVVKKL